MKISELNDVDILDFLMTSDFMDGYSPDEFRYLLTKWRYFYRIFNGKYEINKTELEGSLRIMNEKLTHQEKLNNDLINENIVFRMELNAIKNRKLTWKERFFGEIITKEK